MRRQVRTRYRSLRSVSRAHLRGGGVYGDSNLVTSWQIEGFKVEAVIDCIFLGSKITPDGDCNHEIKRHLLLGKKAMTNLHSG